MDELTCPQCSAVCTPEISGGYCPHCGYNFGMSSAQSWKDATNAWVLLFVAAWGVLVFQSGGSFGVVALGLLLVFAWTLSNQQRRTGLQRLPAAPSPNAESDSSSSLGVEPSKPSMPDEWQTVAQLRRPRDVYLPSSAKIWLFLDGAIFIAVGGLLLWYSVKAFARHPSFAWVQLLVILWIALWLFFGVARVRDIRKTRELLRDGELTAGVLTIWRHDRYGNFLRYHFWSESGQKFEAVGRLHQSAQRMARTDLLQVFYLSSEPKRNVALCCTPLRIRTARGPRVK
jgi:hypothetical protein